MMPESFEHGVRVVGLVTLLGFALAFLLSTPSDGCAGQRRAGEGLEAHPPS